MLHTCSGHSVPPARNLKATVSPHDRVYTPRAVKHVFPAASRTGVRPVEAVCARKRCLPASSISAVFDTPHSESTARVYWFLIASMHPNASAKSKRRHIFFALSGPSKCFSIETDALIGPSSFSRITEASCWLVAPPQSHTPPDNASPSALFGRGDNDSAIGLDGEEALDWQATRDLNPQPLDLESSALPN